MKRRLNDRRAKPRFEIVGDLWGTLDTIATLVVRNLGASGALLESPFPLTPGSVHWVNAVVNGHAEPLRFRVRHTTPLANGSTPRYLVGVEFMTLTDVTREFIERHLALGGPNAGAVEGV